MKRVLTDMDGILVELLPTWLHEYGVTSEEWIHLDSIRAYRHEHYVSYPELFWGALETALEAASPVAGSSVFNRLCDHPEYEVYIVTLAHGAAPNAHRIKLDWLERYYPAFPQDRVIFTGHKHLVRGDILIEDSAENIKAWAAENPSGESFLMDAPYNPKHESYSWDAIAKVLL